MKCCGLSSFVKTCAEWLQSPFLLLIRLYWGSQFLLGGLGKLQSLSDTAGFFSNIGIPFPYLNAVIAGSIEFLGGLCLVLGFFSRLAAIPLIIVMCVAYATAHPDALTSVEEFIKGPPFTYLLVSIIILIFGPGKLSLDYLFCKRKD